MGPPAYGSIHGAASSAVRSFALPEHSESPGRLGRRENAGRRGPRREQLRWRVFLGGPSGPRQNRGRAASLPRTAVERHFSMAHSAGRSGGKPLLRTSQNEAQSGLPAASARGWQLPSLPRRALCVGEPDPRTNLERVLGTLDGGLGCFPCDSGPLRPESHSCAPHSEMPRPRWQRYPPLLVLASSTSAYVQCRFAELFHRTYGRSAALLAFRGKPDILDLG